MSSEKEWSLREAKHNWLYGLLVTLVLGILVDSSKTSGVAQTPGGVEPLSPAGEIESLSPAGEIDIDRQQRLQEYRRTLREASPPPLTLEQLQQSLRQPEQAPTAGGFPSLGSDIFDTQLVNYLRYLKAEGTPDILIVGSSRALQGIDPSQLQTDLAEQRNDGDIRVYNFSVNGATAQVVRFMLTELLPEPLPAVIIWGDGSRAFNAGRRDRTYERLLASSGYHSLQHGTDISALISNTLFSGAASDGEELALTTTEGPTLNAFLPSSNISINDQGFSSVWTQFEPARYYQQFAQVAGQYDGAYQPFELTGNQSDALVALATEVNQQQSQLIFVNLPLSDSYLDNYRLEREIAFQQFLEEMSTLHAFEVIDWLQLWTGESQNFADPSHINAYGASAIAQELATHPALRSALTIPSLDPPQPDIEPTME